MTLLLFTARRLAQGVFILLLVTLIVFILLRSGPGDPARLVVGGLASQETVDRVAEQMGLRDPLLLQYGRYLGRLLQGDAGTSFVKPRSGLTVAGAREGDSTRADRAGTVELIAERVPLTLQLAALAMLLALAVSLPLGIWAGLHPGRWPDALATLFSATLVSLPNFWLASVLALVVSLQLGWLPAVGYRGPSYTVLPAIVLAVEMAPVLIRSLALSLAAVRRENFVRIAPIRGLTRSRVLWRHALKNASVPMANMLGIQLSGLLGGVVVVEYVFDYPGLGHLLIESVLQRDFPLVQAIAMIVCGVFLAVNIVVDGVCQLIDPRLAT
jgi:peptide/nickel transport system permease protein